MIQVIAYRDWATWAALAFLQFCLLKRWGFQCFCHLTGIAWHAKKALKMCPFCVTQSLLPCTFTEGTGKNDEGDTVYLLPDTRVRYLLWPVYWRQNNESLCYFFEKDSWNWQHKYLQKESVRRYKNKCEKRNKERIVYLRVSNQLLEQTCNSLMFSTSKQGIMLPSLLWRSYFYQALCFCPTWSLMKGWQKGWGALISDIGF